VSTIRFAGYLGLLLIIALLVATAVYSTSILKRSWNTPYRPLAIILALGAIYRPFEFIFIFGEYRNDLPAALFTCGMLKLLGNSLRQYEWEQNGESKPDQNETIAPQPALGNSR
jgi:hypothetical protein